MPRIHMLRKQAEFFLCEKKWAAARGGVGSGKTMSMVWWMIRRMRESPRANHVVVGADYDQLRRGFFPSLLGVLEEDLGWERGRDFTYRENPTPMVRFVKSGVRLRSMSAELAQRVRSVELQTLYCEEPQTWHNGAGAETFRAIALRLRHSRSSSQLYPAMPLHGRMTFNPPAVGTWLHKLITEQWLRDDYPCWRLSLRDNVLLLGQKEYVRQAEAMYPPEQWPVEIEGEWATLGGDVYRGFDLAVHGVDAPQPLPPMALDPQRPILWSLDFNVEWMASVICQVYAQRRIVAGTENVPGKPPTSTYGNECRGWQRDVVYCLDEIFLHDSGTPDVVEEFLNRYGDIARKSGLYLYGDPAGGARAQTISSHAAARSNWEIVLAGLLDAKIPVTVCVRTAAPPVMDRINAVRVQFRTGEGVGFLVDTHRCPNLITDFQAVRFKPGTNDIEKDVRTEEGRKRTHLCLEGSTLISTVRGDIAIKDVVAGDMVWTRQGLRDVTASLMTERGAKVMRIEFSDGSHLDLTPNHPVYVEGRKTFVAAENLTINDECVKLARCIQSNITDEHIPSRRPGDTGRHDGANRSERATCTVTSGKMPTDQFQRDGTFITSTATLEIMFSRTLSAYRAPSTLLNIAKSVLRVGRSLQAGTLLLCRNWQGDGTLVQQGSSGTANTELMHGRGDLPKHSDAYSVANATRAREEQQRCSTVAVIAKPGLGSTPASMTRTGFVPSAEHRSALINTKENATVPVNVVRVTALEAGADVFDVTVADEHEFFANGILVSNSDALGYLIEVHRRAARGNPPDYQSFMSR